MPKIITYSLRLDQPASEDYYRAVAAFADTWQPGAMRETAGLIAGFCAYRQERGLPDRSDGEYAFELLVIGVLLNEHAADIARMSGLTRAILKRLVSIQKRWPRTETLVKHLRGWTGALARIFAPLPTARPGKDRPPTLADLLDWLRANEENGKASRLAQWQAIFDGDPKRRRRLPGPGRPLYRGQPGRPGPIHRPGAGFFERVRPQTRLALRR